MMGRRDATEVELLEQRVSYLEHRIHSYPKWRWLQLVAWVLGAFLVALAFSVQGRNIDVDKATQRDACVGIVSDLDATLSIARFEVAEGLVQRDGPEKVAHIKFTRKVDELEQARSVMLASGFCSGVTESDLPLSSDAPNNPDD